MTTLGVLFLPHHPPEALPAVAQVADEAGLAELWITEDCFMNSGIAAASAALACTERLTVGLGILPVPLRNVALCAMEIATMRRLFGERALIGIGHGVQEWMAQAGARPVSPLTLMREYATALRALLCGETVTAKGQYVNLDAVALDWPPSPPPKLMLGATGPKSLALSGELGDGTILAGGITPAGVHTAMKHIAPTSVHEIVVFMTVAAGPGGAERLRAHRERSGPDSAGVNGNAADIAEMIREYAAAGATRVVLEQTPGDADVEGFVRFVAEELRPLVA
jgi:alkanesulfonate monooxygenase SsuD/methylene tetrahydromethanopterin reductase-like flavin-dependent oxidoreductase (luciferase family)